MGNKWFQVHELLINLKQGSLSLLKVFSTIQTSSWNVKESLKYLKFQNKTKKSMWENTRGRRKVKVRYTTLLYDFFRFIEKLLEQQWNFKANLLIIPTSCDLVWSEDWCTSARYFWMEARFMLLMCSSHIMGTQGPNWWPSLFRSV